MTKRDALAERRAFIWKCFSKYKMTNTQAREATKQKFLMQSYPQRTFEYDVTSLRQERREKLDELARTGIFDTFWGTVDGLKSCIQDLQVIVASSVTSPHDKIAAIDTIATIEIQLLNVTSVETIEALKRVRSIVDRAEAARTVEPSIEESQSSQDNRFTGNYGR
jgi:hypothetical protein